MNYEFFMRAALAESSAAAASGELADGAVAVLDEALVAHGRAQVRATGDPTAHAVICALREAARRLGRGSLSGLTVFSVVEPCTMCVGALLASDADGIVFALGDPTEGAAGSAVQLADGERLSRRLRVVSGILQEAAGEVRPDLRDVRGSAARGFARAR
ncbi:tRNA adenosine(34) deaminase TadA [soil metagenome]|nr:nucleoside deaminase [Chloroflexota bacterium]